MAQTTERMSLIVFSGTVDKLMAASKCFLIHFIRTAAFAQQIHNITGGYRMYRVGILTASDKGAAGEREDLSAGAIREIVSGLGWVVEVYRVVPDDPDKISHALIDMADREGLDLVLTTGGTGFSPRDNTPEATRSVIEREAPGIPEVMRAVSLNKTPRAMLSRAVAGIRKSTLIINLPGSQKAVRECLEAIIEALPHGLEILTGRGGECGSPPLQKS